MAEVETVTIPVRIEWVGGLTPDSWTATNAFDYVTSESSRPSTKSQFLQLTPKKGRKFRALLVSEGKRSTDGRMITYGALYTREPPLPLMWLNRNTQAHEEAIFVGNILSVERVGAQVWAYGEFDTSPDALEATRLVDDKKLRGISMDTAVLDYELIEEGEKVLFDVKRAELMGATIVPFPAFDDTYIELLDEDDESEMLVAALDAIYDFADPAAFKIPEPEVPTPWTVTEDGRVFGHLALWGECHQGITDTCALAPRSKSGYAHFMIGRIGDQHLGTVTMNTVHVGGGMTRNQVARHYADTGTVAAYVSIVDGKFGPWVSGVMEPSLSEIDQRRLAACGISGDWRGNELIGILAVPKPGFTVPRYADPDALVASAIGSFECVGCEESKIAAADVAGLLVEAELEAPIEVESETTVYVEDELEDDLEPTPEEIEAVDDELAGDIDTILADVLREMEEAEAAAALERILLDE